MKYSSFLIILLGLLGLAAQSPESCQIGDNTELPISANGTHFYFIRCRDYDIDERKAKTTGCLQLAFDGKNLSTSNYVVQNCGPPWNTNAFLLSQRLIEDSLCVDNLETDFQLTMNGALVASDRGCWSDLRGKSYQLGSVFVCASDQDGPTENCAQWLSLDATNAAKVNNLRESALILLFGLLVLYLVLY